jgi:hypothetical protein
MSEQQEKAYFNGESLKKLIAAEGKQLKGVICILWQNSINKGDVVELIDHIQFVFTDGYKLTLGSNQDNTGLEVVDYNFEEEKAELAKEFGDKIKLFAVNATPTKMWKDVEGLKLDSIQITKEGSSSYLSDSVLFNFGTERRTVSISPLDGIIIDFYED